MAEDNIINGIKKALEESPDRNFTESLELSINLRDIDLSNPDNRIDEEVVLPNGRGKTIKVGFFGSGEMALNAKDSADIVIEPEEIEDLSDDKRRARKFVEEHEFFLAEPPLMPVIGRELGAILGPKGKMPSPVTPDMDIKNTIDSLKNTVHIRSRDRMTFHAPIGTEGMEIEDLTDNANTVIRRITMNLERREMNIKSIFVKTTMGPAVRIM